MYRALIFTRAIYPVKPDFFILVIMQNGDGITIGNRDNFDWPGKTGGWYGEEEEKKGEAATAHAGLPQ